MEIIADSLDFSLNRESAVAIGKFDGVHIGHRFLLEEILQKKKDGLASCVLTFDQPPSVVFGIGDGKVLTTREEKRRVFRELGVEILVEFPMNPETAAIEAEDFVRMYLSDALCAKYLVAGEDLSFGKGGKGNSGLLMKLANELSFEMEIIPKVHIGETVVSSTYIRSLIEDGKMEEAQQFLGTPYCVDGVVLHGRSLGHKIGYPTINLLPDANKLLPPFGVYLSKVQTEYGLYPAVTNIGIKPTVGEGEPVGVESCLIGFDGDLYGKEVQIFLHSFLRAEQKFRDLDQLKKQLAMDFEAGKQFALLRT